MKCNLILKNYSQLFAVIFFSLCMVLANSEAYAKKSKKRKTEADYCVECSFKEYNRSADNIQDLSYLRDALVKQNLSYAPAASSMEGGVKWSSFPEVVKYSDSSQVSESIHFAIVNKLREKAGKCWKYVKDAILAGSLVTERPSSIYGKAAAGDLEQQGFINMMDDPRYKDLIKSPKDAPKGAILVYKDKGSPKAAGHAEIKTDWGTNGGYVSDFFHDYHDGMSNYKLTAVMIREI